MSGRGPAPKPRRNRRRTPERGEWKPTIGYGWQHGPTPEPPADLLPESIAAWQMWMDAWYAANWHPGDLPSLRVAIRLFDEVRRGKFQRAGELRLWLDTYGVTPKGQQDRRWIPPAADKANGSDTANGSDPYRHLRVVARVDPGTKLARFLERPEQ